MTFWTTQLTQVINCICPYCKMYLYKLQNAFVYIAKCICSCEWNAKLDLISQGAPLNFSADPGYKLYLSILQNVFVQIAECICSCLWKSQLDLISQGAFLNYSADPCYKLYLSILQNVFVQIAECICINCYMYLYKLLNVFVPAWKITAWHDLSRCPSQLLSWGQFRGKSWQI